MSFSENLEKRHTDRRQFLRKISVVSAGIAGGLLLGNSDAMAAPIPNWLRPGDIVLGRTNEWQWWGYWRHAGIFAGNGIVLEGGQHSKLNPVVGKRSLTTFCGNYVNLVIFRTNYGQQIAMEASRRLGQNLYCSALVKVSHEAASKTNVTGRLLYPDDITVRKEFTQVFR